MLIYGCLPRRRASQRVRHLLLCMYGQGRLKRNRSEDSLKLSLRKFNIKTNKRFPAAWLVLAIHISMAGGDLCSFMLTHSRVQYAARCPYLSACYMCLLIHTSVLAYEIHTYALCFLKQA